MFVVSRCAGYVCGYVDSSDRGAFPSNPQTYYKGKDVCATGLIESYKGKPEIIARDGDQLEIQR